MDRLRILLSRCVAYFRSRRLDSNLEEELREHVELATQENRKRGIPADEARRLALRDFGGVTQITESYREQRGLPLVQQLGRDLRFALRQLRRNPVFACTAVITLALGIGANTAVFSVVSALLLRPLPYANADRLVRLYSVVNGSPVGPSPLDSRDFARQNRTFEKIAVFDEWRKNVITSRQGDNPETLHVGLGNFELFQVLGMRPIVGRLFTEDEGTAGRNHVALISDSFWQSHYGRDGGVLGRSITINGIPYTIVGVLPSAIPGWLRGVPIPLEVWEPFLPTPRTWDEAQRGGRGYTAIGRLKPGVSIQQAQADLGTVAAHLASTYPDDRGIGVKLEPLVVSRAGDLRPQIYLLMGAVGLILLITCANLAALLLARNAARQREFAMRAALGARRSRLVRQIFAETLLIAMLGGGCGVGVAIGINLLIRARHPQSLAQLADVTLDWRVLVFTFAIAVGASLLFGLAPALMNSRIEFAASLKDAARGSSGPARHGFRKALVMGQIALALVLTVISAVFIQTIVRLVHQDVGARVDHLVKAHFYLPGEQYPTPDAITRFSDAYTERLRSVSGISDVSITMIYPPYERWDMMFSIEGRPVTRREDISTTYFGVTDANFLRTAGIPILRGRDFAETDNENAPAVAIVNQAFVNRFFAHEDPLGQHVELGAPPNLIAKDPWMLNGNVRVTVVGVMRDSKNRGLELPAEPQLIGLFRQLPIVNLGWRDVLVRSTVAPAVLERTLEQQLHALDPKLSLSEVEPMNIYMEGLTADRRFTALILTAFAALGLLLALVGVYGVVSYLVMQRNQDLAIRMALGAERSAILWLIVREGMALAAAGIAIGLACNVAASRALAGMLYRISPLDAVTVSATSILLFGAVVLASVIPARRATRIDPVRALRTE